ncbi:GTPase-activating protein catalytic subunit [Fragilaria crotonensis]|nr:GTPase-activating protein catalytic subunit [Fragilaria crotonensis]
MSAMNHDEYTDYSCSTSIERLARDIETIFRKWHLTGADRHVSFSHKERQGLERNRSQSDVDRSLGEASGKGVEQRRADHQERGRSRSLVLDLRSEKETNHLKSSPSPTLRPARKQSRRCKVQLIRTHPVEWTVNLAGDGGKATLSLNLDLWDGPSDENESDLPMSLRRVPLGNMPVDLFSDLSTVFGIGQHITLSLKKDQELTDIVVWTLGGSLVQRHDSKLTPWVATATLSNILQTSLQCALSNISCNIPAFGIWGTYAPSSVDARELNPFRDHAPLLPNWIQEWHTPSRKRSSFFRFSPDDDRVNHSYVPPILKSSMLCDTTQFWMSVMPSKTITTSRLTAWGDILLQHSSTPTVVLIGAKHLYSWTKPNAKKRRSGVGGGKG